MKKFLVFTLLATGSFAVNANPFNDFGKVCLREGLCLGTPIEELAALPLQSANNFDKINFHSTAFSQTLGLDHKGQKIYFGGDTFDRNSIKLFMQKVKSVCSVSGFSDRWKANLKTQDRRDIRIILDPYIYDGRTQFVVSRIEMVLPRNTSKVDEDDFYVQLKQAYGDYLGPPNFDKQDKPSVEYRKDYSKGAWLELRAPYMHFSIDSNHKIKEMPGCTEKLKL